MATYTDSQLADLQVLGLGDIADLLGIDRHAVSMRLHRTEHGKTGGWDFPAPHATLGACRVWLLTEELQAAIDRHRT